MKKVERENLVIGQVYHTTSGEIHSKLKFEGRKDRQIFFSLIEKSPVITYVTNDDGLIAFQSKGQPFYQ